MHEVLHWASGGRLPIVMANINRTLGPGWNVWTEQTDSLAQRDTGWLQFYCETNQEVLDTVIQAYKIAENVLLPVMLVLDAFVLSHTEEPVNIPDQEAVDRFLPSYNSVQNCSRASHTLLCSGRSGATFINALQMEQDMNARGLKRQVGNEWKAF